MVDMWEDMLADVMTWTWIIPVSCEESSHHKGGVGEGGGGNGGGDGGGEGGGGEGGGEGGGGEGGGGGGGRRW